jgi:hypothetical protein
MTIVSKLLAFAATWLRYLLHLCVLHATGLTAIFSGMTVASVFVALWQFRWAKKQSRTRFEDDLAREYRHLIKTIPIEALLGDPLTEMDFSAAFSAFYHYIDLSNEQEFLRQRKKISRKTWQYWCDGIKSNLSLPAFARAWAEIKAARPKSFIELQELEKRGFRTPSRIRAFLRRFLNAGRRSVR